MAGSFNITISAYAAIQISTHPRNSLGYPPWFYWAWYGRLVAGDSTSRCYGSFCDSWVLKRHAYLFLYPLEYAIKAFASGLSSDVRAGFNAATVAGSAIVDRVQDSLGVVVVVEDKR